MSSPTSVSLADTNGERARMTSFDYYNLQVDDVPFRADLIPQITRAKFARCNLTKIPAGLSAYHHIKVLELSENSFQVIDSDELTRMTSLQQLDVSMNQLKSLCAGLPPSIVHLDLSYNPSIDIISVWNLYLPKLEICKLAYCGIRRLPERPPSWAATIKSIFLEGNSLQKVPNCMSDMPLLEDMSLFGNSIQKIKFPETNHSFKNINLGFAGAIKFSKKRPPIVQSLILNANIFKTVPATVFALKGLRVLSMARCNLKGNLEFELPSLVAVLDISYNNVSSLSEKFVSSLSTLSILNISHNKLKDMPDCFPSQICFSQLSLSDNKLTSLPSSLMESRTLERLNLSHNKIETLLEFKFPQLREIDLSFNNLSKLPDSFNSCSFLISANFSFNKLTTLPDSMTACRRMLDLFISGNQIESPPRCILSFASLRTLSVSYNRLTALPKSMSSLFFLKTLDLSNNHFETLPDIIPNLMGLRFFSISHNRISSVPEGFVFPKGLVNLDLSFNLLGNIHLNELQSLASLSLDCNKLTSFKFETLPSLHFLSVSGNSIPNLPELVQNLPKLNFIETLGNTFEPSPNLHVLDDNVTLISKEIPAGISSTMGTRPTMEDSIIVRSDLGLFAVLDGHAGPKASAVASYLIASEIETLGFPDQFGSIFQKVNDTLRKSGIEDGCTIASVLIKEKTVYSVGIGDSRAVIVKKQKTERMTEDHKPFSIEEFTRLKEAGLGVSVDGRIKRRLAVARALGDFWCGEGLFVNPDVRQFDIEEDDMAVVIACDGIWDVLSDDAAGEIVRKAKSIQSAAVSLKNIAIALGSSDNVSVIVVGLTEGLSDGFDGENVVESLPIMSMEELDKDVLKATSVGGSRRRR